MQCLTEPSSFAATTDSTDLRRQWLADQRLRQRVPTEESWRGGMGLAALIDDPNAFVDCGVHRLLPGEALRWLALRDVPASAACPRGASLATVAKSRLRYGMPQIHFTDDAIDEWNFQLMPFDSWFSRSGSTSSGFQAGSGVEALNDRTHSREFAVLNSLSSAMTRFAFHACDQQGRPVRPAWWRNRPAGDSERVQPAAEWFPRPYLAYSGDDLGGLYDAATCARSHGSRIECRGCGRYVAMHSVAGGRSIAADNVLGRCPACGHSHKWDLTRAVPARVTGQHPIAFKDQFCRAVAEGLPLGSIGTRVYCGSVPLVPERDYPNLPDAQSRALELVVHRFRDELSGKTELVYLPPGARLRVRVGEALRQGQTWCQVLAEKPDARWSGQDRLARWQSLDQVLGGNGYVDLLQRVWFDHQAVTYQRLGSGPRLLPADLVSLGAHVLAPLGLFWDFPRSKDHEPETSAAVFPPLRLHQWNNLRFNLPGDVAMDASFTNSSRMAVTRGPTRSPLSTSPAFQEAQAG